MPELTKNRVSMFLDQLATDTTDGDPKPVFKSSRADKASDHRATKALAEALVSAGDIRGIGGTLLEIADELEAHAIRVN